jgi:hypothetical protein
LPRREDAAFDHLFNFSRLIDDGDPLNGSQFIC